MSKKPSSSAKDPLAGVRQDVIGARHHFEIYRTWMHERYRARYRQLFLVYDNFIATDLRAHFAGMVVSIGRVFDSNPRDIGIAGLLAADPSLR